MTREDAIRFLKKRPYKFGHLVGFTKLTRLNNEWIKDMAFGKGDRTLQAHRLSYKTTCVSVALALLMILHPNERILFLRKTDSDVSEIIEQVKKILQNPAAQYIAECIYGVNLTIVAANQSSIQTNLSIDPRGTPQLSAFGCGSSITGKHYDRVFTDDIVNLKDRRSRAEREQTKAIYMELRNVVNRPGRIYNTGTPWHKDDAFSIMPAPERYDCYQTGMISEDELQTIRGGMTASLFAANYELRHIASEDVLFMDPQMSYPAVMARSGNSQLDAAYGGADTTALTICQKHGEYYYVYGRIWHKHVDACQTEIIAACQEMDAGKTYCENNGDKGYLAKELRRKGLRVISYHEDMNKYLKISTYLKAAWAKMRFVEGTDQEYIDQVCDYNENAEHDDAADSLASIIRKCYFKEGQADIPDEVLNLKDEAEAEAALKNAKPKTGNYSMFK